MTLASRVSRLCFVVGFACSIPCAAGAAPSQAVVALSTAGAVLVAGRDHVALSRELPSADPAADEPEAVRLVFVGFDAAPTVRVSTLLGSGAALDSLNAPSLTRTPCPSGEASTPCWATAPLRLAADRLDRAFAPAHERTLEAELGGELLVESAGRRLGAWRVGAPHDAVFVGLERLSARLRVRVLRLTPGGMPAVGGDTASALLAVRREVLAASKLWAQCGVDLQGPAGLDVQVVDPPPLSLVAVGCDSGLPASGGQVNLRVRGRRLRVPTRAGESPRVVAEHIARALQALGVDARLSPNQRMASGAAGAIDVVLNGAGARAAALGADSDPAHPLIQDATLGVCLGEVDLSNGLSHFVENDAASGTLEERALIKAFDDGDPSTIEVLIVPSFDQSGRIGESFIDEGGAGIQNTVLVDRAALRAGPRSYALAHELGHVLLDLPGHPDDYGVDQASSLMDSDASDASALGPRRLSLEDCRRMVLQSGPGSPIPLLQAWPLPAVSSARPSTSAR